MHFLQVTFDTSKHLSESALKKRSLERLKLQELERQREEQKRREKEEEERRKEEERYDRSVTRQDDSHLKLLDNYFIGNCHVDNTLSVQKHFLYLHNKNSHFFPIHDNMYALIQAVI